MSNKRTGSHATRNVTNAGATALARSINNGGDANSLLRSAVLDAQIHADWRGVAAVENSLTNIHHRSMARQMLTVGARGIVVQRTEGTELARHIPDGFEFGIAWLVTSVFLVVNGGFEALSYIGQRSWERLSSKGTSGILWGRLPIWASTPTFGPPARSLLTAASFTGDLTTHTRVMDMSRSILDSQAQMSSGGPQPLPGLLWGCYVTGSHDLSELLDPSVWAPGLDLNEVSEEISAHIAAASISSEVHIHPQVMPANQAHDFVSWMFREQSIHDFREYVFGGSFENTTATIALLEPSTAPYLDMISLCIWSRTGRLRQTLTFPRSGEDPKVDADRLIGVLRQHGLANAIIVRPKIKRHADEFHKWVVDANGDWKQPSVAGLGHAIAYVRTPEWSELDSPIAIRPGMQSLPSVTLLERIGAIESLTEHYQPAAANSIKAALGHPGNPEQLIRHALHALQPENREMVDDLLDEDWDLLMPKREIALSAQFKLAGGALINASKGLIGLLDQTDIGGDCPVEMMRPSYDTIYLRAQKSAKFDDFEDPCTIDGILVQHWEDGGESHLLLDTYVCQGEGAFSTYPLFIETMEFKYSSGSTLDDLRKQLKNSDDVGRSALDLVAGVFLYMNSKDARLLTANDRTALAAEMAGKSRKKRRPQDYQQLNGSYDHILVGPEEDTSIHDAKDEKGRTVKAHYRRGFVRTNQRYGPGRSMTRAVFIPPVLVNAKAIAAGQDLPQKRTYNVA